MIKMLHNTESRTLQSFLTNEFSRVGSGSAKEICENAALLPNTSPKKMSREMVEKLVEGIKNTKLISPPTDCISPIGAELLEKGLRKEINAEFYATVSRPPSVYRGNPFLVEVGIAYGGDQKGDSQVNLLRFANRCRCCSSRAHARSQNRLRRQTEHHTGCSRATGLYLSGVHCACAYCLCVGAIHIREQGGNRTLSRTD
jgi:DNA topoisomerase VI B subunit